nr:hypothetical protein [Neobacillus sp. Marseille-Q6967]
MDIQNLKQWVKKIKVTNLVNADVEVVNDSPLEMMGKGRQGAVFKIDDTICMKVFGNNEDCEREYQALSMGQHTNLFPKLYGKGPNYIAMEIIGGVDLREYLQSQPLTPALSEKLIQMLIIFKEIGYERIDHHKRQIYIQQDGSLKVIDVARTIWRDRVYPYPRKLLNSLGEENKAIFLSHVQGIAPELYQEWLHYIRMEEISRQITSLLLPKEPDKQTIKNLSKGLLTTEDEKNYVTLLHGLVHKVFKEEWVKTMLARGEDLEAVMGKIDEYWDNRELAFVNRNHNDGNRFEGYSGDRYSTVDNKSKKDSRSKGDQDRRNRGRFEGEHNAKVDRPRGHGKRFEGERRHDRDRSRVKHRGKGKGRR